MPRFIWTPIPTTFLLVERLVDEVRFRIARRSKPVGQTTGTPGQAGRPWAREKTIVSRRACPGHGCCPARAGVGPQRDFQKDRATEQARATGSSRKAAVKSLAKAFTRGQAVSRCPGKIEKVRGPSRPIEGGNGLRRPACISLAFRTVTGTLAGYLPWREMRVRTKEKAGGVLRPDTCHETGGHVGPADRGTTARPQDCRAHGGRPAVPTEQDRDRGGSCGPATSSLSLADASDLPIFIAGPRRAWTFQHVPPFPARFSTKGSSPYGQVPRYGIFERIGPTMRPRIGARSDGRDEGGPASTSRQPNRGCHGSARRNERQGSRRAVSSIPHSSAEASGAPLRRTAPHRPVTYPSRYRPALGARVDWRPTQGPAAATSPRAGMKVAADIVDSLPPRPCPGSSTRSRTNVCVPDEGQDAVIGKNSPCALGCDRERRGGCRRVPGAGGASIRASSFFSPTSIVYRPEIKLCRHHGATREGWTRSV